MPIHTHDLSFGANTVVKCYRHWDRGEPEREWTSLKQLAEHQPGLAPEPVDQTVVDGRPAIVMSRLPGEPLGAGALTRRQARAVGDALRRLHEVSTQHLPDLMAERLTGPSSLRTSTTEALAPAADLTRCADPALVADAVVTAQEWLAAAPLPSAPDKVLGRADGNLANCLWDGRRVRLVDFEDAGGSDPAFELADHVEHISFRRAAGDPALVAAAGGLADQDHRRFSHFRKDFAVFWLAMLLPGNRGFARNPSGSLEWQARYLLTLLNGDRQRRRSLQHPAGSR